ncbi:MAG: hypothetical protein FGM15_06160 [Chthoniobacterales bacterium]|nr:hypothetical protein [Chthoniobacterales bacterium]
MNTPSTKDSGLTRAWTVYLIHHTHTDIGYTETQGRIARYHLQFLDDVVARYRDWKSGDRSLDGFVWTIECFWSVEQWLALRGEAERETLAAAIRDGFAALSATYLHFNEMIDYPLVCEVLARAARYAKANGLVADTAVSADINGHSWGYAQALHDTGATNLVDFLHSHHGMSPLGKRQVPFWWETPKGDRVLVWNGEHYMLGNALGLVPAAMITYVFADELTPCTADSDSLSVAKIRLPRYLRQLERDGYPQDFLVVGLGGTLSDNAPPHFGLPEFIRAWNAAHGHSIRLEMTSPSAFMKKVREEWKDIPVHRGDWPDWWSDGLASMPDETRFCRTAQRGLERLRAARETQRWNFDAAVERRIEQSIALYCEHTFNHSDSMKSPWDGVTKHIAAGKTVIASSALSEVCEAEDELKIALGEAPMRPGRPFLYRIVNPFPHAIETLAPLYLEYCDFHVRELAPRLIDHETGEELEAQKTAAPRGWDFLIPLRLDAGQSRVIELAEGFPTARFNRMLTNDSIRPELAKMDARFAGEECPVSDLRFSSPHAEVAFDKDTGLAAWKDASTGLSLLAEGVAWPPFTPVYEHTPVDKPDDPDTQMMTRTRMGRNRKGANVERHAGNVRTIRLLDNGPHLAVYRIDYELAGARMAVVELRLSKHQPVADVVFRINKESLWDPENLYLSLPFDCGEDSQIWLDKAGAAVRPVIDQLPGTLTDWYCLQSGYAVCGKTFGIAIACLDAPLLQLGPLEPGTRLLANGSLPQRRPADALGWLMTNYWETNFEASLGGFHEFRYRIRWGKDLAEPRRALDVCRKLGHEPFVFRCTGPAEREGALRRLQTHRPHEKNITS